jgi:hypothetical protein
LSTLEFPVQSTGLKALGSNCAFGDLDVDEVPLHQRRRVDLLDDRDVTLTTLWSRTFPPHSLVKCDAKVNIRCNHRFVAVSRRLGRDIGAESVLVTASQPCFAANARAAEALDGKNLRHQ